MSDDLEAVQALNLHLAAACPFWSASQWTQFHELSPHDQLLVARGMTQAAQGPTASGWQKALDIITAAGTVVVEVAGVASAVLTIQQVIKELS